MALFKYFKKCTVLPNPEGPLSSRMPPAVIVLANKELEQLAIGTTMGCEKKRDHYLSYTDEEKAKIAKRAAEFGVTNTIRYFRKEFNDRPLKESTVRTWMNAYKKELARRVRLKQSLTIDKLPKKKRGHPYLLGEEMDRQLQEYIKSLREAKAVINSSIVISAAEGIVKGTDQSLLAVNGGHIKCSKDWAKHFLTRIGYVKRKARDPGRSCHI